MSERAIAAQLRGAMSRHASRVLIGLVALAIASYAFLAIAARGLEQAQFARLALVWALLFTIGPGLFSPLEQDLSRRLSYPETNARYVVARTAMIGAVFAASVVALASVVLTAFGHRLIGGDWALIFSSLLAIVTLLPLHLIRGYLAGRARFNLFAAQLVTDGSSKMVGAGLLLSLGVRSASGYVFVLAVSHLIACAVSLGGALRGSDLCFTTDRTAQKPTWRSLMHGLMWLTVASFASQTLVNGGVLYVKFAAGVPSLVVGQFLTALTVSRQPLFFFGALQAPLLPSISSLAGATHGRLARIQARAVTVRVLVLGSAFTLLVALFGPVLVAMIFGRQYRPTWTLMLVLSAGCVTFMCAAIQASALVATKAPGSAATAWLVGTATFLCCLTIPGSATGTASIAFLAGATIAWAAADIRLRRQTVSNAEPRAYME